MIKEDKKEQPEPEDDGIALPGSLSRSERKVFLAVAYLTRGGFDTDETSIRQFIVGDKKAPFYKALKDKEGFGSMIFFKLPKIRKAIDALVVRCVLDSFKENGKTVYKINSK